MIGSKARGRFDLSSPPSHWQGEHDLTDGRSLVPIAGELREREAARRAARRKAWEGRQRRPWLVRALIGLSRHVHHHIARLRAAEGRT